jgi:hypothetical protein
VLPISEMFVALWYLVLNFSYGMKVPVDVTKLKFIHTLPTINENSTDFQDIVIFSEKQKSNN